MICDKNGVQTAGETAQEEKKDMEYPNIFCVLEKKFQDAFIEELIPGIVHNFANPLNGIMGRSKLLQRKLMEIVKNRDTGRDVSSPEDNKKLINDVESIAREADRLSAMLQHVTGKFCTLSDKAVQKINVSDLIEREMKFFDFYLEFKHSVKKTMYLEREVPVVKGIPADYSLALSALIIHSMEAAKEGTSKEFNISTQFENGQICIKIQNRGKAISDDQKKHLFEESYADTSSFKTRDDVESWCAFALLRKWGARFEIESDSQWNTIAVIIPPYEENTV
jgi:signal transduction histidine kinase